MAWYIHDGAVHETVRGQALPEGAIKVQRPPRPGERWDETAGRWHLDAEIAADFGIPPEHIAAAHLVKQIEASLILSGVALTHGLLIEEARATARAPAELAAAVAANAAAFRAREVERRRAKTRT